MNLDKVQISPSLINKNIYKDYIQISRNILYKKYNFDSVSSQKMCINSLIFNYKCRFSLLFKEFLILYDNAEFLRNFYTNDIITNLLNKILDIYYLYSKIYPNYINLKENKFLYKNIRKKQKMLDENNESEKKEKDNIDANDNDNKENDVDTKNELFTLSVRNEIKEFQENSLSNIKYNDNIYNQISLKRKKINDNWFVINNNRNDLPQKNNNYKNMSTDSFWTNDTNNLSFLLNAINEKIFDEDIPLVDKYSKENNKTEIKFEDLSQSKTINQKIKEIEENNNRKYIYKKVNNKKFVNDGSRNNYIINKENINTQINKINNINITKPISASVSNKKNMNDKSINKSSKIFTYQLTAKTGIKEKKLNQYYSIERDSSDNKLSSSNLKTLVPSITIKRKFYSKDFSKENKYHLIKKKSQNLNQYSNCKFTKKNKFLTTILNESKNDYSKKKSIENENAKTLSNNFSNIRNKKLILKKYFTNSKFNQRNSYPRNPTITDNYSQLPLKNKNQLNSSLADDMDMDININNNPKTKTLNACHRIEYYNKNTHGNGNGNIEKIKFFINKIKTDSTILAMRDKLIKERKGHTHSKEKCFSPVSNTNNRRFTLSNSSHYKKIKKINMKNIKLVQRQSVNTEMKNKLTDIRKYIKTQITPNDNNINSINNGKNFNFNKSINKINSMQNYLVIDSSQKENKNKISKLNNKENRNIEKIFLRKQFFSPTMTHYDLSKLRQNDLIQSPSNLVNNSDYEFHQDNLLVKKKGENNSQKDKMKNRIDNKENISSLLNNKKYQLKSKIFSKNKSKTDNSNIIGKKINNKKNINIIINKNVKKNEKPNLNKMSILNRFKNKNNAHSKDQIRINEFALQRFHNLSNSTISNSSNYSEFTTIRNFNNTSLNKGVNSVKNIIEFQTPFAHNKRLNLIEKFINQDAKEKLEKQNRLSNNKNISSKITIKVNRTKFLERVIDKMKSKTNFNKI